MRGQPVGKTGLADKASLSIRPVETVLQLTLFVEHNNIASLQLPGQAAGDPNVVGQDVTAGLQGFADDIHEELRLFAVDNPVRDGEAHQQRQAERTERGEAEIKLNIEANHATLAGHSFHHEIATAIALGLFGSVDANRGDPQLGWDTDQFPNSVEENALVMYEILKAGGFTTGGLNFDAKVRRQSTDKYDLFYGHIGAMDTMALSLKVAARMIEDGELDKRVARRYAGWNGELGQQILNGQMTLSDIAQYAAQHQLAPQHRSSQQEQLENLVNHYLFDK